MIDFIQGVYASVYKKTVFTCSPGAAVRNAQFFSFFGQGQRLFQPGQCYSYNPAFHRWQPFSSPMNSYRGGASVTRMGRFFVASGNILIYQEKFVKLCCCCFQAGIDSRHP